MRGERERTGERKEGKRGEGAGAPHDFFARRPCTHRKLQNI